jgi:hypothetical protein
MVHSGYEASAVNDAIAHPIKAAITAMRGMRTEGPMVTEIPLHAQRPAQYMFERQVKEQMVRMHTAEPKKQAAGR